MHELAPELWIFCTFFIFLPSRIALLARLANYRVEKVSWWVDTEGDIHTMKLILEFPLKEDDRILVSLEFLKGMCVLCLSISADMQFPKLERDPFIHVSSYIRSSLSSFDISCGILNFSDPAKSTIRSMDSTTYPSIIYWRFI